jgi:predicted lipoprotein with Yx(FWY)xxD motif
MRRWLWIAAAGALLAVAPLAASAATTGGRAVRAPVIELRHSEFGSVLARRDRQALYYWTAEKRDLKVRCTGACARAWPPLIVRSRTAVPRKITGITGTFGVIRRPDGRLQVTRNRLPLYTYAHERPGQVLCDDVGGWFVVRL